MNPPLSGAGTAGIVKVAKAAENFFNKVNFNIIK
jgi:hypothetical protein